MREHGFGVTEPQSHNTHTKSQIVLGGVSETESLARSDDGVSSENASEAVSGEITGEGTDTTGEGSEGAASISLGMHLTPLFYSVYVLQSITKPKSLYIGSTPDPKRRLRQHNGDLVTGGAYRTGKNGVRPWRIAALVHNFPSKIAALQFEHALQHPHQTRHIPPEQRVTKSRSGGNSLHHKFANIMLLVNAHLFRNLGLQVVVFDDHLYRQYWCANRYNIPDGPNCSLADFPAWDNCDPFMDIHLNSAKHAVLFNNIHCAICGVSIDYLADNVPNMDRVPKSYINGVPLLAVCYTVACGSVTHLTCLAKAAAGARKGNSTASAIIPARASCPKCDEVLEWPKLVKIATHLRHYATKHQHDIKKH